jgi:hypothetical protein
MTSIYRLANLGKQVKGRVKVDNKSFSMFNPYFAVHVDHFVSQSTSGHLSGNTVEVKLIVLLANTHRLGHGLCERRRPCTWRQEHEPILEGISDYHM